MPDPNLNILIVDDSLIMRVIVRRHLKTIGFNNVIDTASARRALEILDEKNIGLIISDWSMPGMTGIDLLRAVRQDDRLHDIPFIMLTAEGQQDLVDQAHHEKIDQYILKPFTFSILKENILRVLADCADKRQQSPAAGRKDFD